MHACSWLFPLCCACGAKCSIVMAAEHCIYNGPQLLRLTTECMHNLLDSCLLCLLWPLCLRYLVCNISIAAITITSILLSLPLPA